MQNFISDIKNNLNSIHYDYDQNYLNDPIKLLLGFGIDNPDCRNFILGINIARFTWISKNNQNIPTLNGFKSFFKNFISKQKFIGKLDSIRNLDADILWQ